MAEKFRLTVHEFFGSLLPTQNRIVCTMKEAHSHVLPIPYPFNIHATDQHRKRCAATGVQCVRQSSEFKRAIVSWPKFRLRTAEKGS